MSETTKKKRRKPTMKQRLAFDKMVENGGNISKAMREVGYSPNTAVSPHKLTESDGWKTLLEENFPDDLIQKKIYEGLHAEKRVDGDFDPDYAVRHKYVDTLLKLADKYPAQRQDIRQAIINVSLSKEEMDKLDNIL